MTDDTYNDGSIASEVARLRAESKSIEHNIKASEDIIAVLAQNHQKALNEFNRVQGFLNVNFFLKSNDYTAAHEREQQAKQELDSMVEDKNALVESLSELQQRVALLTGQDIGEVEVSRQPTNRHSRDYVRSRYEVKELELGLELALLKDKKSNPRATLADVKKDLEVKNKTFKSCEDDEQALALIIHKHKQDLMLSDGTETANLKRMKDEYASDIKRYTNRGFFGRLIDGFRRLFGLKTAKDAAEANHKKAGEKLNAELHDARSSFNESNEVLRDLQRYKGEERIAIEKVEDQVKLLKDIQAVEAKLADSLERSLSDWRIRCKEHRGIKVGALKESRASTRVRDSLDKFLRERTHRNLNALRAAFEKHDNHAARTDVRLMALLREVGEEYEGVNVFLPKPDFLPMNYTKVLSCIFEEKSTHTERLASLLREREVLEESIASHVKELEHMPKAMQVNKRALAKLLWAHAEFQKPRSDAEATRAQGEAADVCSIKIDALKRHMTASAIYDVTARMEGLDVTAANSQYSYFLVTHYDINKDIYQTFRHALRACTTSEAILSEPFNISKMNMLKAELGDAYKTQFYQKVWPKISSLFHEDFYLVTNVQAEFQEDCNQPFNKKNEEVIEAIETLKDAVSNQLSEQIDDYGAVIDAYHEHVVTAESDLGASTYDEASPEAKQKYREAIREIWSTTMQALQSMQFDRLPEFAAFKDAVNNLSRSEVLDASIVYQPVLPEVTIEEEKTKLVDILRNIRKEEKALLHFERLEAQLKSSKPLGSEYVPEALLALTDDCVSEGNKAMLGPHKKLRVGLKNFLSYPTMGTFGELKERMKHDLNYVKNTNLVQLFERASEFFSEVDDLRAEMTPSRSPTPTTVESYGNDTSSMSSLSSDSGSDDEDKHNFGNPR